MIKPILTKRLILRPIEANDFEDIYQYGSDEQTGKYMFYWPKTKAQIKKFIEDCVSTMNCKHPTWFEFVMELQPSSKVIGNISLILKDDTAEIGWISNKNYWNHGYMSEAVKEVIHFAFQNLTIKKIIATCSDNNIASFKVMEKCGMKKINEETNQILFKNGKEVTYTKFTYVIFPL